MKLNELAKAVARALPPNHSILCYGPPKSGKTELIGTAAKLPEIHNIYWFDLENGSETLLHMGLTEDELAKITIFRLKDRPDKPIAIQTMLRVFSAKQAINICDEHGIVECIDCKRLGVGSTPFWLGQCTHNDLVVIDSGSQLGDSALIAACMQTGNTMKPGWDEYGPQGKWLAEILTVIQQAAWTNFIVLTHELIYEEEINGVKRDKIVPLMGSKNFSLKVAKYFGTVVYLHMFLGKHAAGSSTTYKNETLTGSRLNVAIEKSKEKDMRAILIEGGILRQDNSSKEQVAPASVRPAVALVAPVVSAVPVTEVAAKKVTSLAAILNAKKGK